MLRGHVSWKTPLLFSADQPEQQKKVFLGFRVNMSILAGKMQGNQGAPGLVGPSVGLFLERQSETPDNHDTGLYFNTGA